MAANTGRTISKWTKVYIDDSGGTLREIPVNSINGVGIECPAVDVSAWQDAIRNVLVDTGACSITLSGPFDSTAATAASGSAAAPTISGSHTILAPVNGLNTPLAFGVCFGMRQYYTTGEPAFGLNFSAGLSGFVVRSYLPNPDDGTYTAILEVFGTVAPSWLNAIPTS
jgi:hypothetical protein